MTDVADSVTLSLVHVNDIHGAYNYTEEKGTHVARIAGYCAQVRAENPLTLFTNGGDD